MAEPSNPQVAYGKKTFAEILAQDSLGSAVDVATLALREKPKLGLSKGKPSITFSKQQVSDLAAPYKRSLVEKFSQERPMLEDIHSYLISMDLKASFKIASLDGRHIIINFQSDDDYYRIYSRKVWYLGDSVMSILKWNPDFHVDKESPIVLVWIELEKLPIFLFQKDALFSIASTVGIPLRLDAATAAIRKPSVARIQVELNLLKERPDMIWIGLGEDEGFWQKIKYSNIPMYCTFCWHVGHDLEHCHVKNPTLRNVVVVNAEPVKEDQWQPTKTKRVYRPKEPIPNKENYQEEHVNQNKKSSQLDTTRGIITEAPGSSAKMPNKDGVSMDQEPITPLQQVNDKAVSSKEQNILPQKDIHQAIDIYIYQAFTNTYFSSTLIDHHAMLDDILHPEVSHLSILENTVDNTLQPDPSQSVDQQDNQETNTDNICKALSTELAGSHLQQDDTFIQGNLIIDISQYSLPLNNVATTFNITDENTFAVLSRLESITGESISEIAEEAYLAEDPLQSQLPSADLLGKESSANEARTEGQEQAVQVGHLSP